MDSEKWDNAYTTGFKFGIMMGISIGLSISVITFAIWISIGGR